MPRKPLEYNATCTAREEISNGLDVFRVRPDDQDAIETFVPGQYTVLGMNHPEKGPVSRMYSIASPPDTLPDYFEYYVRHVDEPESDNPLTHLLFTLQPGDRLWMGKKAKGNFTVEHEVGEDDPRLRICVSAGTGLAPFTSMVFHAHARNKPLNRYLVMQGAKFPEDLGYREQLESIMNPSGQPPRYFPSVSRREMGAPDWPDEALRGRVESHLEPGRIEGLEQRAGLEPGFIRPENAVVFICGLQGTIATATLHLLHRGFVPRELKLRKAIGIPDEVPASLFFEQYDSNPILDLKDEELMNECRRRLAENGVPLEPTPVE